MLMMSVTAYRSNAHNLIPMSVVWRPKCGVVCEVWCGVLGASVWCAKCGVAPSVRPSVSVRLRPSPSVRARTWCAHSAQIGMLCTRCPHVSHGVHRYAGGPRPITPSMHSG